MVLLLCQSHVLLNALVAVDESCNECCVLYSWHVDAHIMLHLTSPWDRKPTIDRAGKSITPDPMTEGVVGIPELVAVVAPLAGYFLFGYSKAPWGKTLLPCQAGKPRRSSVNSSTNGSRDETGGGTSTSESSGNSVNE